MPIIAPETNILTIPGLDNSGPTHWQSLWEHKFDNCERIELGQWNAPDRALWVARIGDMIAGVGAPILIAAHSLGCHAFTHWLELAPDHDRRKIAGALLVAPPDLSRLRRQSRVTGFDSPAQFSSAMPMPLIVVGSDDDPFAQTAHVWRLSRQWGARFVNAGPFGHINADSDIADWPYGQYLLASLQPDPTPALARETLLPALFDWRRSQQLRNFRL
jgi:hypothetical protein